MTETIGQTVPSVRIVQERTDRSETGTEMVGVRSEAYTRERTFNPNNVAYDESQYPKELDSGIEASGILEVMPDGYGFHPLRELYAR